MTVSTLKTELEGLFISRTKNTINFIVYLIFNVHKKTFLCMIGVEK